jgi:hypothetical protein
MKETDKIKKAIEHKQIPERGFDRDKMIVVFKYPEAVFHEEEGTLFVNIKGKPWRTHSIDYVPVPNYSTDAIAAFSLWEELPRPRVLMEREVTTVQSGLFLRTGQDFADAVSKVWIITKWKWPK